MEIIILVVFAIVFFMAVIGYFMNFIKLAQSPTLTGLSLLRVVGIFAVPAGCVLGFVKG